MLGDWKQLSRSEFMVPDQFRPVPLTLKIGTLVIVEDATAEHTIGVGREIEGFAQIADLAASDRVADDGDLARISVVVQGRRGAFIGA